MNWHFSQIPGGPKTKVKQNHLDDFYCLEGGNTPGCQMLKSLFITVQMEKKQGGADIAREKSELPRDLDVTLLFLAC